MQTTTYITDNKGKRISAIIPIQKYQHLLSEAEELDDIRVFDLAMNRKHEFIPLDEALKYLETKRKMEK